MTILLTILISLVVLLSSYFVGRTIVENCDSLFATIFLQTTVGLIVLLLYMFIIGIIAYFSYKFASLLPVMI